MKNAIFCIGMSNDNLSIKLRNWQIELDFINDFDLYYTGNYVVNFPKDNAFKKINYLIVPISDKKHMIMNAIKKLDELGYEKIAFIDIDCTIIDLFSFRNALIFQNSFVTGTSKKSKNKNFTVCIMNDRSKRKIFIDQFNETGKINFDLFENGNFLIKRSDFS